MNRIAKGLAIVASVAAIGGIGLSAMGQPAGPGSGPSGGGSPGYGPMGFMHGGGGPGMMGSGSGMMGSGGGAGFADPVARLDALKTDLAIRPEQTAAWDAYVKAVQDSAGQMRAMRGSIDFDAMRAMSWTDMQATMGKLHDQHAQAYKEVQAAATTLLAALDDTQKTHALLPRLVHAGPGMMAWQGGSPVMGPGMGMMGPGMGMMSGPPGGGGPAR